MIYKDEIKKLRRKKNSLLLSVLFSAIILILFYVFAVKFNWINKNLLDGVYLFLLIGFLIYVMKIKNSVTYYLYKYNYLLMLQENLPPIKTNKNILSDSWEEQFIEDEFILHKKNASYSIYYQLTDRHSNYKEFGKSLFCIVVNRDPKLDFYGDEIQHSIRDIYDTHESKYNRLKKEFVIQFKKYDRYNKETKKELQKILNFKQDSFSLINITVGYFPNTREVYYLRPERRFPNRYYYLACKFIEKYI